MNNTDGEPDLIARARSGDMRAYRALVERHQEVAFRVAYLVTRSAQEAEEAAQDGLVKAWKALDRFREGSPFAPWLLQIVRNEALNRVRARSRRERMRQRVTRERGHTAPAPEMAALTTLDGDHLAAAVDELPDGLRHVISCRYLLGFSVKETAQILDIPRGTVKSRAARARELLVAGIVAVVAFIPASRDQVAAWLGLRGVTIIETPFDSPAGNGLELGSPVSLEEATRRAGFEPLLSSNLGEPYNVFVENGRIWMLFEPGPLLPEMSLPGVGAIVMQFRPEHGPGIVKGVGVEGAEYIQFGGVFAVWIEGPHELMLMVPSGNAGDGRSVGNTLLWETESLTIRIETGLTQPSILEIARSFR